MLISTGVITEKSSIGNGFGYEGSGVVMKVGSSVQKLSVGDRVVVSSSGSLATTVRLDQRLCTKIPDTLSHEEASTMSSAYATAIICLLDLGRLTKGMSVLIHSAAGGVGIAALHIARMVGAEVRGAFIFRQMGTNLHILQIWVSVSSETKVQYLMSAFGIPRHRIFDSRSEAFLSGIMRETGGTGVDVVLNSLSGELLHASWRCVAQFGTFVEIGRRDFVGQGALDMQPLEQNRVFAGFDLLLFSKARPEVVER